LDGIDFGVALLYIKIKLMSSYRELEIYNESKRLAIEIHALSLTLPKFELYEEGSQIRRSSKAVASTIVEGYGRRRYKADYIKYLVYSQAECDETHEQFKRLKEEYIVLSRKINAYTHWVGDNWLPGTGPNEGSVFSKEDKDDYKNYSL
jgi:four helix bundle protein